MKRQAFLLASLVILAPVLAQADYTNLPQSGIERLPHFSQQHYLPKTKVVLPSVPVESELDDQFQTTVETPFTAPAPTVEEQKKEVEKESTTVFRTTSSASTNPNDEVSVSTEGYLEIPYSSADGVIRIETNTSHEAPVIYGYSEDGLPITDFSNKVNHYKAQFIEQNPHLFKAKKP